MRPALRAACPCCSRACIALTPIGSPRGARIHEALRRLRPGSEKVFFHLAGKEFPGLRLDGHEAIFVDQQRLVPEPLLPGVLLDVLEDALAELTRIRRAIEAFRLAVELHAMNRPGHLSTPRAILPRERAIRPLRPRQVRASAPRHPRPTP